MRILHIVPTYLPAYRYGGPIYSVHELNKGLAKDGVEVTVYTTNIDGSNNLPVKMDIIDGVKINYFKSSFPRSWFYSKELKNALSENIKNFDLVHITSVFLSASYLGAKYSKKLNKPYIISPRGSLIPELISKKSSLLKKSYIKCIEGKNLSGASAIHFTTKYEEDMYKELGLPLKKSIIIPNGIDANINLSQNSQDDINFKQKFGIPENAKILLSLGRLNWKKGFDTLIPAFAEVVKEISSAVLVVVGSDSDELGYKNKIEKLVDKYHLAKNIIFTGDLRDNDKAIAYKLSDVFVAPSYSENFGISLVEAMSYGKPVVVTDAVGIASDIREAGAGIVIKKNINELKKGILELFNDEKLRKELGRRGRELVSKKYVWNEIVKNWITEYTKLVRK